MARRIGPVLQEILTAIQGIEASIVGKTFADLHSEWLVRHGVQGGLRSFPRPAVTFLLGSFSNNRWVRGALVERATRWMAETWHAAEATFDILVEFYGADKAVECLTKDRDALLTAGSFLLTTATP